MVGERGERRGRNPGIKRERDTTRVRMNIFHTYSFTSPSKQQQAAGVRISAPFEKSNRFFFWWVTYFNTGYQYNTSSTTTTKKVPRSTVLCSYIMHPVHCNKFTTTTTLHSYECWGTNCLSFQTVKEGVILHSRSACVHLFVHREESRHTRRKKQSGFDARRFPVETQHTC